MAFTATNAVITDDRITFTLLENIRANTIVSKFANTNSNTGASATVLIVDTKGTDYELFSITDKNQLVYLGAEQDEGAAPREFSLSLLVSTKDSSTARAERKLFTTSFEVSDAETPDAETSEVETPEVEAPDAPDAPDAPQTPEAETNGVITLASSSKTLNEGYNAAQYLTQISFADNADGAKTAYLNEADGQYFEIRNGNELRLKAGRLDFEVASKHTITIRTNDPDTGKQSASKTFTLNLNDVNISLANLANKEFDGAILAGERVGDADALVTGAAQNLQDARYALSGEDASKFNIDIATGVITARAFIAPRISTDYDLTVKVYARYGDHSEYATDSFTVSVNKGQAPAPTKATVMTLSAQTRTLDEDTTARTKLADISFNNDASGANTATIPNGDIFEIDSNVLYLKADAPLDFETTPSHAITLTSGTNNALTKTFTLTVADVDEAPTAIVLSATTLAIGEDVATRTVVQAVENPPAPTTVTLTTRGGDENSPAPAPSVFGVSDDAPAPAPAPPAPVVTHETVFVRTKLIDISFTDDALGTNTATIPDSDIFEIDANVLYLKANAPLNFQTTDSYSIVISASTNSALTQTFTLTVNNLLMTGTARDDVLAGGAGDDTINGGAGDDILVGQAGDNVLNGGAGDDQLFGTVISLADSYGTFIGGGDNTLNGGAGNDLLYTHDGADILNGDAGNDWLQSGRGEDYLYGGTGDDTLYGNQGDDVLNGGRGNDYLYGNEDDDVLFGNAGNDVLSGGTGSDWLFGAVGDDRFHGGAGKDYIFGGAGNDLLNGDAGDDKLYGNDGVDKLYGGDGDDQLFGNAGDDQLSGQDGDDRLYGGSGSDTLGGDAGNDVLNGGAGDDKLYGWGGNDVLNGGAGDDFLLDGAGDDVLNGGAGVDVLWSGAGDDTLNGGTGNDTLIGYTGDDILNGGAGDDELDGGADNDVLNGDAGDDKLYGNDGVDKLYGGTGNDRLYGMAGDDVLNGGTGRDTLWGNADNDVFVLGDAQSGGDIVADFSYGTVSGDSSYDGSRQGGNDRIRVDTETGAETSIDALKTAGQIRWTQDSNANGNAGRRNDTVIYATNGTATTADDIAILTLHDFSEDLTIAMFEVVKADTPPTAILPPTDTPPTAMTLSTDALRVDTDTTERTKLADISFTDDGRGTNIATIADSNIFEIDGGALYLKANARLDDATVNVHTITLTASTNSALTQTFTLTFGDVLNGGAGDDQLWGWGGDDVLAGGAGDDSLNGGAGDDELNGGTGHDHLNGHNGDDVLAGGAGDDSLNGGAGDDVLNGDANDDFLQGSEGDDVLNGGIGDDYLFGSYGDDVFVLGDAQSGGDIVGDFSYGTVSGFNRFDGSSRGGNDRIHVDTATGAETSLAALKTAGQIRWTQDSNSTTSYYNDAAKNDTVIYATKGTATTADDIAILTLEDFSEDLTIAMFDIV